MDGKRFLGTARFLRNKGSNEAAYRSAVSRAYYACFIAIRDLAFRACGSEYRSKAGLKKEQNIGHLPLQRYLKNGTMESVKQLGEDLAALHGSRIDADYNMKQTITNEDALCAIEEAEALLKLLYKTPEQEIGNAINNYIRATSRDRGEK